MKRNLTPILVVLLAFGLVAGCASTQVEEPPPVVEEEVVKPDPDKIGSIDVSPWDLKQGDTANVTVTGTPGREAKVVLEGLGGAAAGYKQEVPLSETSAGVYTGQLKIPEDLAPGRYRLEAILSGGPDGPVSLVSNRSISVTEKTPPPDPCEELAKSVASTTEIYFDFDKDDVRPAGMTYLRGLAQRLGSLPGSYSVLVEGHCDERGTIEYNLALGGRRASAVRDMFADLGVTNVETISKGEEEPVVPNARTEDEHQRNRRAVLRLQCR